MKTLGEIFSLSAAFLNSKAISRSKFIVQQLIAHHLGIDKLELYTNFDMPLQEAEMAPIRSSLKKISEGFPLEYELGYVDFFGCKIAVNPFVLIPRPETELLVEIVVGVVGDKKLKIFDVCTGSGCIGLSLKKRLPECDITLSDISENALALAKKNAELNDVQVQILAGDLLAPFSGAQADVIICNPPYISQSAYHLLGKSVKDFEPQLALIGGESGLEFYQRLAVDLPGYLKPNGQVYMEIGFDQGDVINEIFNQECWKKKQVKSDLAGHPRFFFLEIE